MLKLSCAMFLLGFFKSSLLVSLSLNIYMQLVSLTIFIVHKDCFHLYIVLIQLKVVLVNFMSNTKNKVTVLSHF